MSDVNHLSRGWRFWIDRGGTFTDLVGLGPDGEWVVRKVLSEQPGDPGDPAIRALCQAFGLDPSAPLPPGVVEEMRLGTTVATNALLERQVEPVLLLVNRGLADLPLIGDQHRPHIFALQIERAQPLPTRVIEVRGRLAADGSEVEPLGLDEDLENRLRQAAAAGYRSCAVALLHSYRQPAHELALGEWLQQLGFGPVLLSHRVSNLPRLVPRLATTVVEAALHPVLTSYLAQLQAALGPATRLRVMTSSGALQVPALLQAKDTILSGPAGGMVGALAAARAAGFEAVPILGFDMGGTSTDVFHFDGSLGDTAWERSSETEVSGLRLQASMLPIHTVAAGGGSVLHVDGGRLQVGPRSAGADPGPACYRRGGPLAITDANLLLGRLPLEALPPVFGPGGDQPPDLALVRRRFQELARDMGGGVNAETAAQGALAIANERMAEAIRRISIQRGHDIRKAVLVSFGGAGGQHACALATILGIERVLLHPLAGVLSAWGIGLARPTLLRQHTLRRPLTPTLLPELDALVNKLATEARQALVEAGDLVGGQEPLCRLVLEIRYPASDRGLEVPGPLPFLAAGASERAQALVDLLRLRFETGHRRRYGYVVENEELVVERVVVEVAAPVDPLAGALRPWAPQPGASGAAMAESPSPDQTPLCLPDPLASASPGGIAMAWRRVPLHRRVSLAPGQRLEGPAVVVEPTGTIVLEPGWSARVLEGGELLLERRQPAGPPALTVFAPTAASALEPAASAPEPVDPVRLELYNHRFSTIAEQMGVRLQQSSRSVNIRERLDFSCALFDASGALVANAPHIPVHLGSMGESVAALLAAVERGERPLLQPGDAVAANDPFHGGTHLPDITVITPVFAGAGRPLFFVACRGHHGDVGGITPGSMPPFSRSIEDEGLLLDNVSLLSAGRFDAAAWRARLRAGPHPVRNPHQLLADLQAQVAANRLGVEELERLIAREGIEEVRAYMAHVQTNAAEAVRRVIDGLHDGAHAVELDDGAVIRVAVRIDRAARRARIDFSGTSPQQPGNLNAPLAITKAVVLYAFRCLVGQPIPLNAGCFEPIDLVVPQGCLLRPEAPAAVVAGNVETSQAVANALFGALGVMAAAQGTMNNLSFGDERRQYYETICGGTGAGPSFAGADAVQSHMTNSRLTDPEILEDRFPVVVERFALRRGSGGRGRHTGGNGVERWLRFEAPLSVSLLTGSRRVPPFGLAGGESGQAGENRLVRADGSELPLPGCAALEVEPGDQLRIATPGGGGYGTPEPER